MSGETKVDGGAVLPCPGSVLVVEDDADIRDFAAELLEGEGFRVSRAANGRQALDYLHRATGPTCLILLDLMMPVLSGEEFRLEQLDDPTLASIPVVLMSGGGDMRQQASALGISEYLQKPISLRTLLGVVARYCHRSAAAAV